MKIILNNIELSPLTVTGNKCQMYGATRNALSFVFPADTSMEELDQAFAENNCEKITIITNDGAEYIHKGYTIRVELVKKKVEIASATEETEAVFEGRAIVTMAQRTYAETQLANLTETVDTLVLESLMAE